MSIAESVKKKLTIRHNGKDRIPPRYYRKLLGLDSIVYKDMIEDHHKTILQAVKDFFPKARLSLGKCAAFIPSRFYFAGEIVTHQFHKCLETMRRECDERLKARELNWRQTCAATI
jgi:hypothetical protein